MRGWLEENPEVGIFLSPVLRAGKVSGLIKDPAGDLPVRHQLVSAPSARNDDSSGSTFARVRDENSRGMKNASSRLVLRFYTKDTVCVFIESYKRVSRILQVIDIVMSTDIDLLFELNSFLNIPLNLSNVPFIV